jgi:hypothetical protein
MRFRCLSTSSYHPVQFQGIIGPCCYLHSARTDYVDKFLCEFQYAYSLLPAVLDNFSSGGLWASSRLKITFLTDEICSGGLWVLSLFDLQWCKLPLSVLCFFWIFLLLCSSSCDFHAFVLLGTILCIFQGMFNTSAHLHWAHMDSADNFNVNLVNAYSLLLILLYNFSLGCLRASWMLISCSRASELWVLGFVALWSAMVEIATHCPLFLSLIGMCIWTMWGRCIMWFWVVFACLQLGKFENVSWMPPLATWRTTHSSPRKLGPRAEAVTEEEVSTSGGNEKFDRVEVWEPPRIERLYEDDLIIAISKPGTLLVSHLTDSWCLYWLLSEFICFLWAIKVIP